MKRSLAIGAALLAFVQNGPVLADQTPQSAGYDPHVQLVPYNPLNVVRIVGSPKNSTQIIFAGGEEITQVAIGDANAWLAQPAGNLLFLKPTLLHGPTNMQVVTKTLGGANRSYQFQLIAVRYGDRSARAIYAVSFTYPADEAAAREMARVAAEAAAREKAAEDRLQTAWSEGPRNWRYVAQGSNMIEPTEVSDNGRQTAFRFPGNMRVPTIYTAAPDGSEMIVPYTMVGDTVVVQTTARIFTLRDGQKVLRVINQGFDPVGRNPGTGTGTPDLARTVRSTGQ